MNELIFKKQKIEPIIINNTPYLTVSQIDLALGYKNGATCRKIYERHSDEFTKTMSFLAEINTKGGKQTVRVFSLRGCHLLAMFSHTNTAKEFRKWVLDVIENQLNLMVKTDSILSSPDLALIGGTVKRCVKSALRELNPVTEFDTWQKVIASVMEIRCQALVEDKINQEKDRLIEVLKSA